MGDVSRGILVAAVIGVASLAGAVLQSDTAAAAGGDGELTIGITQFPGTLHPNIDAMAAKYYVLAMTNRPLSHFDHDWEPSCMLCTELPTLENGLVEREALPDGGEGLAITLELHPEATWGDGTPVTTEDVVFTWEVGRHPGSGISNAELYRRLLDVRVHDGKRFTFLTDRVSFRYNVFADFRLLPAHIERPIFESDPDAYRNRTAFDADPTNPALAWGPYRITEITPGAEISLEPNETWYGQPPAFDRITVRAIENSAALEANLLSGSIDMIAGELGLEVDQAMSLEPRLGGDYQVEYVAGLFYEHIDLLLDNPVLADRRVRQALLYAIDREAVSERLFGGHNPVAHGNVSPLDRVHAEDIQHYAFDPERAGALLDEAGWSELRDGVRHNAEGEALRLDFMTTAGNRTRELLQQVLQSQWREVGVDARIRNETPRVFFGQTLDRRNYGAMALFGWLSSPEHVPRTTLHSEEIPTADNGWTGQNYSGFSDPRVDELIDLIEVELDPEVRLELWHELQTIYAEELPVLPLFWRAQPFIVPDWLAGLRPTGHMLASSNWVEEWHRRD
ncbi:peptide ABC transporter substrate-binding protein [Aquibaculum arenosum]|uniref:Peptide ABC transporter substrate-binding protein n=1 Tax=Aquibaculum arenosum TaxID=3032591 RepID=A0ABT5YNP7_9PROT|nr:peptide ABC transporter substrate-binding protein [Fodinicurvata sp. CAU 1616]MDF2096502.1 peptide ABC transporter substrate-binding protein [Fodinicurvata sp. CAU 1616]